MVFAKLVSRGAKSGYTLVEVLVVVIIMGVLSTMGVASLQRAVANARVKDAAINTAAFIERVANLSSQRNEKLCLGVADCHDDGLCKTLIVVRADPENENKDCSSYKPGNVDEISLDAPSGFVRNASGCPTDNMPNWLSPSSTVNPNIMFDPHPHRIIGLSAMPTKGLVCIRYGGDDIYGAVRKDKNKNKVVPMWKVGNDFTQNGNWSNWTEL